jgi:hypothetical protein
MRLERRHQWCGAEDSLMPLGVIQVGFKIF